MTTERAFSAGQRFLLAAKGFWTTTLYTQMRKEYEAAAQGKDVSSVAAVAEVLEDLTIYRYFAWLERHLQRMKYAGRYGLARFYDEHRESFLDRLGAVAPNDPLLELHPELQLPKYYTDVDIHQHPGGVWSDDVAGLVYEHGARSTTPLLGAAHADLHTRFTDLVAEGGTPASVLDMGCGFGKSTRPFIAKFGNARIEAVDLSEPCLRVAAQFAHEAGNTNVHFRQRDASNSGFADNSFDLVTSTMLLHEVPPGPLDSVFAEAFRVLEPGGRMVHLDFYHFPDAFTRFMHYGHGRRNNEPYMQPLAELDLPQVLRNHGFTDIEITPFAEAPGAQTSQVWRFPWTVISARKPRQPAKS
jgi:ubiquinone/menaquinone biosynthesis C-methylase UbiE